MKKPNITKGKWVIREAKGTCKGVLWYDITPHGSLQTIAEAKQNDYIPISINKALCNAKAISAVPEMIDALIKARRCYQGVGDFEACGEMMSQIIPEIDNALKKAGCTE